VAILRDRHGLVTTANAQLEDRAAGHLREAAEPVDRRVRRLRGEVEVVERSEARVVLS